MKNWILTFLLLIFGCHGESLDNFIKKSLEEWGVPGAAVAAVKDKEVILLKGYGVSHIETKQKVDPETVFQLASITKAFTAAAIGVQVDQQKLTWDEEVILHLPQFALKDPYPSRYTTARDLLAHRTGLPAFGGDLMGKLGYTSSDTLFRIRFIEPATSFRDKPHYSNAGYFVAGELLSAVSGKTWEEAVQETILDPLKMTRSGFASKLQDQNVAYPYVFKQGKLTHVPWDTSGGFQAAGAMTSTAKDMAAWMIMLLSGGQGVLKPDTIQEMFVSSISGTPEFSEAPPIDENSGFNFGLGWDNYHFQGYMIVEKGGGLDGIRTVTTLVPELNLGITILCNRNLTLFPEAIRAFFLEEHLGKSSSNIQEEIKKRQKVLDDLLATEPPPKNPLPARDLNSYTGTYSNALYEPFLVQNDKGKLIVKAGPAKYRGTLTHFSGNTFLLSWPQVNMGNQKATFVIGPDGQATEIQTESLGSLVRTQSKIDVGYRSSKISSRLSTIDETEIRYPKK